MINKYQSLLIVLFLLGANSYFHSQTVEIQTMKAQVEVLKLNTDLLEEKISLAKEVLEYDKYAQEAKSLKEELTNYESKYSSDTEKAALILDKNYVKLQKKSASAEKSVSKSFDRRTDYEAKIKKIENKLEAAKYLIEINAK